MPVISARDFVQELKKTIALAPARTKGTTCFPLQSPSGSLPSGQLSGEDMLSTLKQADPQPWLIDIFCLLFPSGLHAVHVVFFFSVLELLLLT